MNDARANIAFIGFRGTGKSTIAALLVKKLAREIVSTDKEIEKNEEKTIAEIVGARGWEYFRKIECEILQDVCTGQNIIIDCGGGIVLQESNRIVLQRTASKIIWLQADVDIIEKRIGNDKNRIRFTDEKTLREEIIYEISQREKLYAHIATHTFNTSLMSANESAENILKLIHQ